MSKGSGGGSVPSGVGGEQRLGKTSEIQKLKLAGSALSSKEGEGTNLSEAVDVSAERGRLHGVVGVAPVVVGSGKEEGGAPPLTPVGGGAPGEPKAGDGLTLSRASSSGGTVATSASGGAKDSASAPVKTGPSVPQAVRMAARRLAARVLSVPVSFLRLIGLRQKAVLNPIVKPMEKPPVVVSVWEAKRREISNPENYRLLAASVGSVNRLMSEFETACVSELTAHVELGLLEDKRDWIKESNSNLGVTGWLLRAIWGTPLSSELKTIEGKIELLTKSISAIKENRISIGNDIVVKLGDVEEHRIKLHKILIDSRIMGSADCARIVFSGCYKHYNNENGKHVFFNFAPRKMDLTQALKKDRRLFSLIGHEAASNLVLQFAEARNEYYSLLQSETRSTLDGYVAKIEASENASRLESAFSRIKSVVKEGNEILARVDGASHGHYTSITQLADQDWELRAEIEYLKADGARLQDLIKQFESEGKRARAAWNAGMSDLRLRIKPLAGSVLELARANEFKKELNDMVEKSVSSSREAVEREKEKRQKVNLELDSNFVKKQAADLKKEMENSLGLIIAKYKFSEYNKITILSESEVDLSVRLQMSDKLEKMVRSIFKSAIDRLGADDLQS